METTPFTVDILVLASVLLLLAGIVRAFRLYISLGALRPSLFYSSTAHFTANTLGYISGAFVYELVVILFCSVKDRAKAIPTLFSLMLIRGFDAVIIIIMAVSLTSLKTLDIRLLVFFLLALIVLIWGAIYAVNPILVRFERNLLETDIQFKNAPKVVRFSYQLRQNLKKLPWEKKGTLSMVVVLSMFAWLLEWVAIGLLWGGGMGAAEVIVNRVGASIGVSSEPTQSAVLYNAVMPSIYIATVLLLVVLGIKMLRNKKAGTGL